MEIYSSYSCAATLHYFTAARFRADCSPHCSLLLCNEASLQAVFHCRCTYGDLLFIQLCSDPAPIQCSRVQGQNAVPTVQCCSAMKGHCRQCFIAVRPMEICCTYRCAVTQHKCSAALFRAKCTPHCSVLLCNEASLQAVCHCRCTYGDLLFIQLCSDPAPIQCSKVQGKLQSPLFSASLQ